MRGALAVFLRELEECRLVFAAAAVAALVPFLMPLAMSLPAGESRQAQAWIALLLAATFAFALSIALGSSTLASDLAEGRIGFYFSRPIAGPALWAGKLGAALLVTLGAALLVYAPTLLAEGAGVVLQDLPRGTPAALLLGATALLFVVHAGTVALRTRTMPLVLADLVALVTLSLAALWVAPRFAFSTSIAAGRTAVALVLAAGGVGVVLGGLAAVTRGRSSGEAAHRVLSLTVWSCLAAGLLAARLYAFWVSAAGARDLEGVAGSRPASRGPWVLVDGEARGMSRRFLLDSRTGRFERLGLLSSDPMFSADGRRAVWFEQSRRGSPDALVVFKLDEPAGAPTRTAFSLPTMPIAFLSEHGDRLAAISSGKVAVFDVGTGTALASVPLPSQGSFWRGQFLDRDRLRLFRDTRLEGTVENERLEILELDLATKRFAPTGKAGDTQFFVSSPGGDRLLFYERGRLTLRDGRTGALVSTLADRGPSRQVVGRFLSDGRIAVAIADGGNARLELLSRDGARERSFPLPGRGRVRVGGEAAPGRLVVATSRGSTSRADLVDFVVDLETGETRSFAEGLLPIVHTAVFLSSVDFQPAPGSEAVRLFVDAGGALTSVDPLTGERRAILRGKK